MGFFQQDFGTENKEENKMTKENIKIGFIVGSVHGEKRRTSNKIRL